MTEELIEQYKQLHNEDPKAFSGTSTLQYAVYIGTKINRLRKKNYNLTQLLDYGCGQAIQYRTCNLDKLWDVKVDLYDPGVERYKTKPLITEKYNIVLCSDVLEHLEEKEIDDMMIELNSYATHFVFVSIALFPARRNLPDGRNAHTCLKPQGWWISKVQTHKTVPWYIAWHTSKNVITYQELHLK